MSPFLNNIRRLSKNSFKSSGNGSSNSSEDLPSNTSTSTVNTAADSLSPPSTLPSEKSTQNLQVPQGAAPPPIPVRPTLQTSHSNRYSINNASSTAIASPRSPNPSSFYAPRVLSVSDNSWVHQKVLLIYGQIADPAQQAFDGVLWVCHHQDSFPATSWPVCDSHFKALVHLQPGPNRLRLDFVSAKIPTQNGSQAHSTWININYLPLVSSPPLDLVILLGKDSPGTYDAVPERQQREGNGLETAIRKYKMAAYLWQAYTGEQMNRNSFGRRCFRFEEEWQQGTLSHRDVEQGTMRNEAKVHIIRSEKTVEEIRDLERAQQHKPATQKQDLYEIALKAVRNHFKPQPGQKRYVSVLILDTHWDPNVQVIRGHAALGGVRERINLAIFGSHALQSYPTSIEEVVPAFSDCTRTDTNYVANDLNESGSNWEAANIGIGAHMHEVGHLFGCPHQEFGIMRRAYVKLNRTFTCREPFSTRTKSPGQRLCVPQDECKWHRLDCLRFRFHPCFRLPSDMPLGGEDSVQVWSVDNSQVMITAGAGIAWIELKPEEEEFVKAHIEYLDSNSVSNLPKQVTLNEADMRSRLPESKQKGKLKVKIFSAGLGKYVIEDFSQLASKSARIKLANGQIAFKSGMLGASRLDGSRPEEVLLWNVTDQRKLLTQVRVYHGFALDGMEFVYEDASTQMFGKKGGQPGGSIFNIDTRRGEVITGFYVRAGVWIDAIQILTSLGRKSDVYGSPNGGSGHMLMPPRGYSVAGIQGSCGKWVDGFSLVITR